MPSIIRNDKQEAALQEIVEALDCIRSIDKLQDGIASGDPLIVALETAEKKRKTALASVRLEGRETAKLRSLLNSKRASICKQINALAAKYQINLDASEQRLLDKKDLSDDAATEDPDTIGDDIPAAPDAHNDDEKSSDAADTSEPILTDDLGDEDEIDDAFEVHTSNSSTFSAGGFSSYS